jgi:2-hydroxy-3-oxopropionate reductase
VAERVGFVGLGVMGRPMALHLLRAGHPLAVYARRPEATAPLVAAGATASESPAEVARAADILFTMVTGTADSEAVVLGPDGYAAGAARGAVVVDMATISPIATKAMAAKLSAQGIDLVDAPVSGGPAGAEAATLSIMAGGTDAAFARVRPLFGLLGKTIVHMGPCGAGQATKACNQLLLTVTMQGVAEALNLARGLGIDPAKVREVVLGGAARSWAMDVFGGKVVARDFAPGIEGRLYHKDLGIVLELARELGVPVPAAAVTLQTISALVAGGGGKEDFSALVKVLERMGGSAA